ncbi:MAG: aminotransferase class I/II-fold pyridoxal phosphate-dependent enzyme [Flavobacteriaceae bacterium]|nr:aminotransferase class I/II-fold pyridoxal phosphate-dependent enzyme [Flavobacteriaceae bacterium]
MADLLPKIWLSSPHMGGEEVRFVQEAFDTNWVAPLGPNVSGLEMDIENYLVGSGSPLFVAALSSGTAALHLSLILAGVEPGDEVLCQSMTFSASANPIRYQYATPVFIDSEAQTWNLCPDVLEAAIQDRIKKGKKPKALVAVHLYGTPYQVEAVGAICKKYDIVLIEDSAEALGSTYKGSPCGTFGDFGILSFNGNKIITTSGGGALVCKSKAHQEKAVFLATQARDAAPHYQHSHIGYNYRMSNICAGIGRGQMRVLPDRVNQRRAMHAFYKEILKDIPVVKVFETPSPEYESNYWLSCVTIDPESGKTREGLRLFLESLNIESRPLWKPMHLQPVFSSYPYYGNQVAETLFENGLCLPSGSNLSDPDRDRIKEALQTYFA